MIQYILHYSDKNDIQLLNVEIIDDSEFYNDVYPIDDSEAKEIYFLLTSDNKKEINDYLLELIQLDDVENLSKLAQRGEI